MTARPESDTTSAPATTRRALFILGSDRTSVQTAAGALRALGLPTPPPKAWLAGFHSRLLREAGVAADDARPRAGFDANRVGLEAKPRAEADEWLRDQFAEGVHELGIKDTRLAWFVTFWELACLRAEVTPSYAVVLRPAADVVKDSRAEAGVDGTATNSVSQAAGWLNLTLHTERATRGFPREVIRHADLVEDWTVPIHRLGERSGLDAVFRARAGRTRRVHDLMARETQRLEQGTWADHDIPKTLRALLDETWDQVTALSRGVEEPEASHLALDQVREEYAALYEEAEQLTRSSAVAAAWDQRRQARERRAAAPTGEATAPEAPRTARERLRGWMGR